MKVLSYGGGVGSTVLLLLKKEEIEEAIFVNHGGDYPYTYEYVKYISENVFPITVIKPNVEGFNNLYDYLMAKCIIPSIKFRWRTYKFKILPVKKYIKKKYRKATMLIGYTYDERERIKEQKNKDITFEYPLVDEKITRRQAIEIIQRYGLKVPQKSACWFCPFMKKSEIFALKKRYPDLFEKLKKLHSNCMRKDLSWNFDFVEKQRTLAEMLSEK